MLKFVGVSDFMAAFQCSVFFHVRPATILQKRSVSSNNKFHQTVRKSIFSQKLPNSSVCRYPCKPAKQTSFGGKNWNFMYNCISLFVELAAFRIKPKVSKSYRLTQLIHDRRCGSCQPLLSTALNASPQNTRIFMGRNNSLIYILLNNWTKRKDRLTYNIWRIASKSWEVKHKNHAMYVLSATWFNSMFNPWK